MDTNGRVDKAEVFLRNMSASREIELSHKYEDILERRAAILADAPRRDAQRRSDEERHAGALQTAVERNRRLLEDVKKVEERLRQSQVTDPDVLSLEIQYWRSVEEHMPARRSPLLGKGPTEPSPARPPRRPQQQRSVAVRNSSRPPLPRPRTTSAQALDPLYPGPGPPLPRPWTPSAQALDPLYPGPGPPLPRPRTPSGAHGATDLSRSTNTKGTK